MDANASNDSVIDKERFKFKLAGSFDELQSRLDEPQKSEVDDESDDDNSEGKGLGLRLDPGPQATFLNPCR